MVLALAAYVYASIRTPDHEFSGGFAFLLLLADVVVAGALVPADILVASTVAPVVY